MDGYPFGSQGTGLWRSLVLEQDSLLIDSVLYRPYSFVAGQSSASDSRALRRREQFFPYRLCGWSKEKLIYQKGYRSK